MASTEDTMAGRLAARVSHLEAFLECRDANDIIAKFDDCCSSVKALTKLDTLIRLLHQVNLQYATVVVSSSDDDPLSSMEKKQWILSVYEACTDYIAQLEQIAENMSKLDTFVSTACVTRSNDVYSHSLILQRYKQICTKFTAIITRIILLLEKRAVLKQKQSLYLSSIESKTKC